MKKNLLSCTEPVKVYAIMLDIVEFHKLVAMHSEYFFTSLRSCGKSLLSSQIDLLLMKVWQINCDSLFIVSVQIELYMSSRSSVF